MSNRFQQIENEFALLRRAYFEGRLSEGEFKDRLKGLRHRDGEGRCWTIGARTGKWYYYNGADWIESRPPSLQSGRAICIHCGYENSLESDACEYCGGDLEGGRYSCPKCGTRLKSPTQPCPRCESGGLPAKGSGSGGRSLTDAASVFLKESGEDISSEGRMEERDWERYKNLGPPLEEKDAFPDEIEGPSHSVRSVYPFSFAMLWGLLGLALGLIFGVFTGIYQGTRPALQNLPPFLASLHGEISGGLVYGLLGGIAGFVGMAVLGFLLSFPLNLILSIMGGLKIRIEKL